MSVTKSALQSAKKAVDALILEKNCGPILVRLAWHDSGTYDKNVTAPWPAAGGAVASIRLVPELQHAANAGLINALRLLEPIKERHPAVSYADLFQMASAQAIALAGGPIIDMKYGRLDATDPNQCSPEGNLPAGGPGPDGIYGGPGGTAPTQDPTPQGHLRKVFYRMGLTDEDIVALSGAHTFGRAYKDRSGVGAELTKYTDGTTVPQKRADGTIAKITPGGSSWVDQWLIFDNSYFKIMKQATSDPELIKLPTDQILFVDPAFKVYSDKFAESQDEFFKSYAAAHKKLSEQGSKFDPPEGITLE